MDQQLVRIKPGNPRAGDGLKTYSYAGYTIRAENGWHKVPPDVAEYLAGVTVDNSADGPLAFDVATEDEARRRDERALTMSTRGRSAENPVIPSGGGRGDAKTTDARRAVPGFSPVRAPGPGDQVRGKNDRRRDADEYGDGDDESPAGATVREINAESATSGGSVSPPGGGTVTTDPAAGRGAVAIPGAPARRTASTRDTTEKLPRGAQGARG